MPCWVAPGAVEQAAAPIGLNVAPIAALPAFARIVCATWLFKRTSPGASRAQLEARYGSGWTGGGGAGNGQGLDALEGLAATPFR